MIFTCLNNEVNVKLQTGSDFVVGAIEMVPEMATSFIKSEGLLA